MNLHINVIRGCCVLGYFQQRGWEDVKHAKPLCIYANRAPSSNLNINLAEINLFTSSLLRGQRVFLHMHTNCMCKRLLRYQAYIHAVRLGEIWDQWVRTGTCEIVDSQWFCRLIMCSRDTANTAVISECEACGQAEHTISVQMQTSDSEAYAKEVTQSQITRAYHMCCKNIYGCEWTNPFLLEIIRTLHKGL